MLYDILESSAVKVFLAVCLMHPSFCWEAFPTLSSIPDRCQGICLSLSPFTIGAVNISGRQEDTKFLFLGHLLFNALLIENKNRVVPEYPCTKHGL